MSGHYLGQNYDPNTPIKQNTLETARAWDAQVTAARMFLRVQQREMPCCYWGKTIDQQRALAQQEQHRIGCGVLRCMEHVRR